MQSKPSSSIVFIDLEVTKHSEVIASIGAYIDDNNGFEGQSLHELIRLCMNQSPAYVCGHNFIQHDKRYLENSAFNALLQRLKIIDTLYISLLLFPDKVTHKLEKPYKTEAHIANSPFGDCIATKELLTLLIGRFYALEEPLKLAIFLLLRNNTIYAPFFEYINYRGIEISLYEAFKPLIQCDKAVFEEIVVDYPVELALVLSYLSTQKRYSPSYILLQLFPKFSWVIKQITYNIDTIDLDAFALNEFGIPGFRDFESRDAGSDLFVQESRISQRDIIEATMRDESILAILPTGGGKTFAFQMPALIKAHAYKSLTVVISPLQALMKNHVESFTEKNQNFKIAAISGYLSPIERINTLAEVENGIIDILYLAPEALRSNSIFTALKRRLIERFVIDEAHCFSSWGHDFRHDYKYIARFICDLQNESAFQSSIPVSCLTATAKQEVLDDIKYYFKKHLDITLSPFLASAKRTNLFYRAIKVDDQKEKYEKLVQEIISLGNVPTIIYIPQNARACKELCEFLLKEPCIIEMGLVVEPFYSKIDDEIDAGKRKGRSKGEILDDFIHDKIDIVIATTAFGMGIDKPNIQAVIHYETSDSLEAYLQESGRGGRSDSIQAQCIIFFSNQDFDKLFMQQNRTKVEYEEIVKILKEIKREKRDPVVLTLKQLSEKIGDTEDSSKDYDTMIKTALLELEEADIIERKRNFTKIFATAIEESNGNRMEHVHNVLEPHKEELIEIYDEMIRVMSALIGRSKVDPITTDDLADQIGMSRNHLYRVLHELAKKELITMGNDISATISKGVLKELKKHFAMENKVLDYLAALPSFQKDFSVRDINQNNNEKTNHVKTAKKILQSFSHLATLTKQEFKIRFFKDICRFSTQDIVRLQKTVLKRQYVCEKIIALLLETLSGVGIEEIEFSSVKLKTQLDSLMKGSFSLEAFHHSLVYLHEMLKDFKLRKGRLIYYQALQIHKQERLNENTPYQKRRDYNQSLKLYYDRKTESVHILMLFFKKLLEEGWVKCEKFVNDYFSLEYEKFKKLYGLEDRVIKLPLTPARYKEIISNLNVEQKAIFDDHSNQAIMVIAGPGSGKTKTLVHKIASLITLENHKPEHFLMLTHGRAAAMEFKTRLTHLVGSLAYDVDIMTFHSFALELIGKRVSCDTDLNDAIALATKGLQEGSFELPFKTMLILDEYQDVSAKTYQFIKAIFSKMEANKRIIAVGDDDQCINNFLDDDKADVAYMEEFQKDFTRLDNSEEDASEHGFAQYTLLNNYRSDTNLVAFANAFADTIPERIKIDNLMSASKEKGYIGVTLYQGSTSLITPVVDAVENDPSENIAILCKTNSEVLTLYSMLIARGINAKYITSKDGFSLGQLDELQYVVNLLKEKSLDTVLESFKTYYQHSTNYKLALQVIGRFQNEHLINNEDLSSCYTYFMDYLSEITFEEFEYSKAKVIVSTMHKAKGKEFESVYIVVKKGFIQNDYDRRLLYVAITRAKHNLSIHTNDHSIKAFKQAFVEQQFINEVYEEPQEILFTMGLGDLSLKSNAAKEGIQKTYPIAGDKVQIHRCTQEDGTIWFKITKNNRTIAILSKPYEGYNRLSTRILEQEAKGYVLQSDAIVENVVSWKVFNDETKNLEDYLEVLSQVRMKC